jgi:hypothetical protein
MILTKEREMKTVQTASGEDLMLNLIAKNDEDERLLARAPVGLRDLTWARDETWCRGMRAGVLGPDLSAQSLAVLAGENKGPDLLEGYFVELKDGDRAFRRHFTVNSLSHVAHRAAVELVKKESLKEKDTFAYYLSAVRPEQKPEAETNGIAAKVKHKQVVPEFEPAPLAQFLAESEPSYGAWASEEEEDNFMPAFVSNEVWQQGQEQARRGGEQESAAIWTGRLFRDTASPEIFVVLDACIEAEHAIEEKLAVTFSGDTWGRVREVLEIRRKRLNRPHERILGSVHGHPFKPEADDKGRRMCDLCATAKFCKRTTAIASHADLDWHRSVFTAQPWAIMLIWGFNAREQPDWKLYGLCDGTLSPRGIRLLK